MQIFRGYFALGLLFGIVIATVVYLNLSVCEAQESTLWFCGESSEIVLATLSFLNDLAKAIAWPFAAIVAVWLFRGELKELLPKLTRVGFGGAEFTTMDQQNTKGPETTLVLPSENLAPLDDTVAQGFEEANLQALQGLDAEQREPALIRALTFAQLENVFERAYAGIFGSQLRTLNLLNGREVTRKDVETLFSDYQEKSNLLHGWTVDEFMNYLIVWELVVLQESTYFITPTGRNFLKYLVANGRSQEMPN